MPLLPKKSGKTSFSTKYFSLKAAISSDKTYLLMVVHTPCINTVQLPETYKILKKNLPSIYKAMCFNDAGLPFAKEVRHTEIGHLFEHILLEYLCIERLKSGKRTAVYEGETSWNWKEEPKGTFHIVLNANKKDEDIFYKAMTKSMKLLQQIMQLQTHNSISHHLHLSLKG